MMERNPSPAEVHEQGLPPDRFARAHLEVDPPRTPEESREAFARRAFLHRRGRLQMLLQSGSVIASGVSVGRSALSDDPRCIIHVASWIALSLRGAPDLPEHLPMIDDRVTMPNGDEVVALRLRWAQGAEGEGASEPLRAEPPCAAGERDPGGFTNWLRREIAKSPDHRTLSKKQIRAEALRRGVFDCDPLKIRQSVLVNLRAETGLSFDAWGKGGSKRGERFEPHAKLQAEIDQLKGVKARNRRG